MGGGCRTGSARRARPGRTALCCDLGRGGLCTWGPAWAGGASLGRWELQTGSYVPEPACVPCGARDSKAAAPAREGLGPCSSLPLTGTRRPIKTSRERPPQRASSRCAPPSPSGCAEPLQSVHCPPPHPPGRRAPGRVFLAAGSSPSEASGLDPRPRAPLCLFGRPLPRPSPTGCCSRRAAQGPLPASAASAGVSECRAAAAHVSGFNRLPVLGGGSS